MVSKIGVMKTRSYITDEESVRIRSLYSTGMTMADIGREVGRTTTVVRRHLMGKGVTIRSREYVRKLTAEDESRVCSEHLEGATLEDCAKKYSVSIGTISNVLRRRGLSKKDHVRERQEELLKRGLLICTMCGRVLPVDAFHRNKAVFTKHNRHCKECEKWRGRRSRYGITKEQYDALLVKQGYKCACCHTSAVDSVTGSHPDLVVDHDHSTGEVRGLLCNRCNSAIGWFREDADVLRKAAAYLGV